MVTLLIDIELLLLAEVPHHAHCDEGRQRQQETDCQRGQRKAGRRARQAPAAALGDLSPGFAVERDENRCASRPKERYVAR